MGGRRHTSHVRFIENHARIIAIILVLLATARIAATYSEFSLTTDEPAHVACGMQWLQTGEYRYEHQHPPLARVMTALLPYLAGVRGEQNPSMAEEGNALLGDSATRLTLARIGILPLFWLACFVVYRYTERYLGKRTAIIAIFLFSGLPPILGHAGLATTDMALVAGLGSAILALIVWCENPDLTRTVLLGICGAMAVLSKFSSLPFFAASVALILIGNPQILKKITRQHLKNATIAFLIALLVVWAGYRFSIGLWPGIHQIGPAPEFYSGLKTVRYHNRIGHPAYLLSNFSDHGFRHYYLVALGVKSPVPFLLLALAGAFIAFRNWKNYAYWIPLACSLAIFLTATFFSRINIGIRHILPLYLFLAILAAIATTQLLQRRSTAWIAIILMGWFTIAPAIAHPDYLAYFNEIAYPHPERILIDSDLDWGQDTRRLNRRLRELGVTEVHPVSPDGPHTGWNAGRITELTLMKGKDPTRTYWFETIPPKERIGKGILLWHFN